MNILIVIFCGLSIVATYMQVALMGGNKFLQAVRLLPILCYIGLALAVTVMPSLLGLSVSTLLVAGLGSLGSWLSTSYTTARDSIPPRHEEWLRTLRFAPVLLVFLVAVYVLSIQPNTLPNTAPQQPVQQDTLFVPPTNKELDDQALWDEIEGRNRQ